MYALCDPPYLTQRNRYLPAPTRELPTKIKIVRNKNSNLRQRPSVLNRYKTHHDFSVHANTEIILIEYSREANVMLRPTLAMPYVVYNKPIHSSTSNVLTVMENNVFRSFLVSSSKVRYILQIHGDDATSTSDSENTFKMATLHKVTTFYVSGHVQPKFPPQYKFLSKELDDAVETGISNRGDPISIRNWRLLYTIDEYERHWRSFFGQLLEYEISELLTTLYALSTFPVHTEVVASILKKVELFLNVHLNWANSANFLCAFEAPNSKLGKNNFMFKFLRVFRRYFTEKQMEVLDKDLSLYVKRFTNHTKLDRGNLHDNLRVKTSLWCEDKMVVVMRLFELEALYPNKPSLVQHEFCRFFQKKITSKLKNRNTLKPRLIAAAVVDPISHTAVPRKIVPKPLNIAEDIRLGREFSIQTLVNPTIVGNTINDDVLLEIESELDKMENIQNIVEKVVTVPTDMFYNVNNRKITDLLGGLQQMRNTQNKKKRVKKSYRSKKLRYSQAFFPWRSKFTWCLHKSMKLQITNEYCVFKRFNSKKRKYLSPQQSSTKRPKKKEETTGLSADAKTHAKIKLIKKFYGRLCQKF